jgi:hypothetical protein
VQPKNGIALGIRRNRGQKVRRARKGRAQIARPQQRLDPVCGQQKRLVGVACRSDDRPTLRDQAAGKGLGGVAVAKREKRSGHGRDYRRRDGGLQAPSDCATL